MRKLVTVLVLLISLNFAAQDWEWAHLVDSEWNFSNHIGIDSLGNAYVTGQLLSSMSATFNGTNGAINNYEYSNFLAKYDNKGNIVWLSGGRYAHQGNATTDKNGNTYVVGEFEGAAWYGNQNDTIARTSFLNNPDNFLVRFDSTGKCRYFIGSEDTCSLVDIHIVSPNEKELITVGRGKPFCDDTTNSTNSGYRYHISKFLSQDGSKAWSIDANHWLLYYSNSKYISTKEGGLLIFGGHFDSTTITGLNSKVTLPKPNYFANFIAKFSSAGSINWAKSIPRDQLYYHQAITTDQNNNIILSLHADGLKYYDNIELSQTGRPQPHILKLNANGQYQSHLTLAPRASVYDIATDKQGNIYLSIITDTTLSIKANKICHYSAKFTFYCVVKLDSNFNYLWSTYAMGSCNCAGKLAVTDSLVYFMINNDGSLDFNNKYFFGNSVHHRCVIAGIKNAQGPIVGLAQHDIQPLKIYPNPNTGRFVISGLSESEKIRVFAVSGQCLTSLVTSTVDSLSLDLSNFTKGIYFIEAVSHKSRKIAKVAVE